MSGYLLARGKFTVFKQVIYLKYISNPALLVLFVLPSLANTISRLKFIKDTV